jgi:predicted enzyme related to lactoylglutathione lyase
MTALKHPEPFGIATVANDLEKAKEFYTQLYPYAVTSGTFAGIEYFSIMKDGITLVNVFQRSSANPITGTIPILKVESVPEYSRTVERLGGSVVIPCSTCPCTATSFAVCADAEGNQFVLKEASE